MKRYEHALGYWSATYTADSSHNKTTSDVMNNTTIQASGTGTSVRRIQHKNKFLPYSTLPSELSESAIPYHVPGITYLPVLHAVLTTFSIF